MSIPPVLSAFLAIATSVQTPAPPAASPPQGTQQERPVNETPAAGTPAPNTKKPSDPAPTDQTAQPTAPSPPTIAGQGAAATVLGATQTSAVVRLRMSVEDTSALRKEDFHAGPIESPGNPKLKIVPAIDVKLPADKGADTFDTTVSGLVPFGDYTVPIFFRTRQVETLRFSKPGLIVQPDDAPTVAYQKAGYMTLVLENPSSEALADVKARVRFEGVDECRITTDQSSGAPPEAERGWALVDVLVWFWSWVPWTLESFRPPPAPVCLSETQWTAFSVRPSSQVSLRIPLHDAWYEDRTSGLTRSAVRPGLLTLRYQPAPGFGSRQTAAATAAAFEQNVPIQGRFEARTGRLFVTIVRIFALLLAGAIVFLVLRVSIPNYRRKKALKDKLNDTRIAIANLSDQVQSQLRVLVGVDRLVLDERRREGWVLLPGVDELARRVEASLAILNRKVAFVEKLDAVSGRRENLLAGPVAPTRVDAIERNLDAACEALKSDQLSEADFLAIEQRLNNADKETSEPTPEETQAFEELLSHRWKVIAGHFGRDPNTLALVVPAPLQRMAKCFPDAALLPAKDDEDGKKWITSVGIVRADLQLTALEMVREAHFLAPAFADAKWSGVMERLAEWLMTPAIPNLGPARALLAQVAEGTTEQEVVTALKSGEAFIDLDPQCVSPNQSVRLTVRFREPRLNAATARAAVQCDWHFEPPTRRTTGFRRQAPAAASGQPPDPLEPAPHVERGWRVHRYFEPDVVKQHIRVAFFFRGQPLSVDTPERFTRVVVPEEPTHSRQDGNERWRRAGFQTLQMFAALLVPMVTLAITTAGEPTSSRWWDLVGLGFGSEAIRNILSPDQPPPAT